MKIFLKIISILFIGLLSIQAFPQEISRNINQYVLKHWSSDEGLPTNALTYIYRSKSGYLWLASYDGLIRFDGEHFINISANSQYAEKLSSLKSLTETPDHKLWMMTSENGLFYLENEEIKQFACELKFKSAYPCLFVDSKDRIWGGTASDGWFYIKNKQIVQPSFLKNYKETEIRSIQEDRHHNLWFATLGQGVVCVQNNSVKRYSIKEGLGSNMVYALAFDKSGTLWAGTDAGLFAMQGERFEKIVPIGNEYIVDMSFDADGYLWLAGTNGILRRSPDGSVEKLSEENGLYSNNLRNIFIDYEKNIWVTHNKAGISRINLGKFMYVGKPEGLLGKTVNSIIELAENHYLVATDEGFISEIKNGHIKAFKLKTNLTGKRIRHLLLDSRKNLWISTYAGLLLCKPSGKETWIKDLPDKNIRVCFEDDKKQIWVGTRNKGLIKLVDEKPALTFNSRNGLGGNMVLSINQDKDKNLLIATQSGGLVFLKDDKITNRIAKSDRLVSETIFNTYQDAQGVIWLAKSGGIGRYENGKFEVVGKKNGLIEDTPFDILEDNQGNFWLPCNKGIMQISKKELNDYFAGKLKFIKPLLFNKLDGMRDSECNSTTKSIKAKDNSLWFPCISGLAVTQSQSSAVEIFEPNLFINEVIADDTLEFHSQSIELSPYTKRINIEFTALYLHTPEKIRFRYKLEGFDDDWIETINKRNVSYTNLPAGKYSFVVYASNSDGNWTKHKTSISIVKKPYFYQTIWFFVVCFIVLFVAIYLFSHFRILQLKKRQAYLEGIVDERTREIRNKNEILQNQTHEIQQQSLVLLETNQKLSDTNEELHSQKQRVESKNKQITASINYAKQIQQAILPDIQSINTLLPEYFLFYKPRDIVSGDFYYIRQIHDAIVIVVADCTGHGVPGAFMSMLGISFLNEIVADLQTQFDKDQTSNISAANILEEMRTRVKMSLKQTGALHEQKDGINASVCIWCRNTNIVNFAGAYQPLYMVKRKNTFEKPESKRCFVTALNDEVDFIEIKGDLQPLSIHPIEKIFTNYTFQVQNGDLLYMFSDGIIDQLGSEQMLKFGSKRLKLFIQKIYSLEIAAQKKALETELTNWMAAFRRRQIDDMLFMGIKI